MLDLIRRALAAAIVVTALVALMPILPLAFGFEAATVTNDLAGTLSPATNTRANLTNATQFIYCEQTPATITFRRSTNRAGPYFRCYNNWGSDVQVTIAVANANGTGITLTGVGLTRTIARGTYGCFANVTVAVGGTPVSGRTVAYQAAVTTPTSNDLTATLYFPGTVTVAFGGSNTAGNCA